MKRNLLLLIVSSLLLLAACTQSAPAATEAAAPQPESAAEAQTVTPSIVPSATETEIPLPTATLTPEPTATEAPTASPMPTITSTPFTGFNNMSYLGAAYGPAGVTMMVFTVPDVDGSYLLKVEDHTLRCAPSETYDDLLVCETEDYAPTYGSLQCDFYTDDTEELLYSQVVTHVAPAPTVSGNPPWPISWASGNTCPIVREAVKCETEWRTYDNTKCMISSCFNDCGHLYSINSCTGLTGELNFHGQWPGVVFDPYYALNWAPADE